MNSFKEGIMYMQSVKKDGGQNHETKEVLLNIRMSEKVIGRV